MEMKNNNSYLHMTDDELIDAFLNSDNLPDQEFNRLCYRMVGRFMAMVADKKWKERK